MPPRRDIPGFYFDEEKQRYFAIPKSSTVSDFNSSEIKKLDEKIQEEKQKERKAMEKKKPLSPLDQEVATQRQRQNEFYCKLERLKQRYKERGYISEILKSQLMIHGNGLECFQKYQNLTRYAYLNLQKCTHHITGFGILMEGKHRRRRDIGFADYMFVLYSTTPEGDIPECTFYNQIPTEMSDRSLTTSSLTLQHCDPIFEENKVTYVMGSNSIVDNIGSEERNIECFSGSWVCWLTEKNKRQLSFIGSHPSIEIIIRREVVAMGSIPDQDIVITGERSGKINFYKKMKLCTTIDIEAPVCGIEVFECESGGFLCVVSGLNNILLSYSVDYDCKNAILHTVFEDYYWNNRLAYNLKSDISSQFAVFAVESEIPGISEMVEIKFYSLYCPKPLKVKIGPLLIANKPNSNKLWCLALNSLILYDMDRKTLIFYRDYVHFEQNPELYDDDSDDDYYNEGEEDGDDNDEQEDDEWVEEEP